ncbi:MAG TPA: hypothetical protein DHV22_01375 [Xanthomarina gelatinilytica]|uniref:Uncharacterized protein n=1 Tax=Xanthomarina gelatinilytica TaxID=1137281 RepID=A0A3D6BMY6_9FLAO|nr:hypothetical protein [Xanthomarina gelatinilytica]
MKKLKSNKIISEDNSIVSQGHGYKDLRIVSCIGYLLQKHHFIEKMFDKDFVNILSATFKIELKAGTYSKAKKHFDECLEDPHLDLLHFIK